MDLRTLALTFTLILPFMLAGAWWWLGRVLPHLPDKPRHARWVEWLMYAVLVLVLGSGAALAGVMRAQTEHTLTLFTFRLFLFITLGFRCDWVALSSFLLLGGMCLWTQWAALMDTDDAQTEVTAWRVNMNLLFAFGVIGLTLFASDVVVQVVLWHLVPVLLCQGLKRERRAAGAGAAWRGWLLMVSAAGVPFLLGVLVLCYGARTADPVMLRPMLAATPSGVLLLGGVLMLGGLYVKLGLMPLHRWSFAVLRPSPLRTRLLLVTVLPTLDLYIFMRLYMGLFPPWGLQEMSAPLTAFALLALLWSAVSAWHLKSETERLDVLHVNQSGIVLLGMGVFSLSALHGSLLHIFVRAGALLALSGLLWTSTQGRFLPVAQGVHKTAVIIAALALLGVPGTAGFLGVGHIFWGLWRFPTSGAKLLMLLTLAAVMGAALPLLRPWLTPPPQQRRGQQTGDTKPLLDGVLNLPWVMVSAVLLLCGIWTEPLGRLAHLLEQALRIRLHF